MGHTEGYKKDGSKFVRPTGKGAGSTFVNLGRDDARAGVSVRGEAPLPSTLEPAVSDGGSVLSAERLRELQQASDVGKSPSELESLPALVSRFGSNMDVFGIEVMETYVGEQDDIEDAWRREDAPWEDLSAEDAAALAGAQAVRTVATNRQAQQWLMVVAAYGEGGVNESLALVDEADEYTEDAEEFFGRLGWAVAESDALVSVGDGRNGPLATGSLTFEAEEYIEGQRWAAIDHVACRLDSLPSHKVQVRAATDRLRQSVFDRLVRQSVGAGYAPRITVGSGSATRDWLDRSSDWLLYAGGSGGVRTYFHAGALAEVERGRFS